MYRGGKFIEWDQCLRFASDQNVAEAGGVFIIVSYLVLALLLTENENRQLENLPPADFGRLPERLLLSVRTKSINENFLN